MSTRRRSKKSPPDGLPTYRLLTGPDDAAFCHRVSDALALGYKLYGPPAATFDGASVRLYLNGQFDSAAASTNPIGPSMGAGVDIAGDNPNHLDRFSGILDDVRIFSVARSEQQILADFNLSD